MAQSVAVAVTRRFLQLVSRDEKGPIKIIVKFRETGKRLATYQLEVAEVPVVDREILKFRRGSRGKHFVDFSKGKGSAITNESVLYGQEGVKEEL